KKSQTVAAGFSLRKTVSHPPKADAGCPPNNRRVRRSCVAESLRLQRRFLSKIDFLRENQFPMLVLSP
ncbi:MAG: hypothetical protein KKH28_00530, partial [Elusimicrobia bacterium]|nr:hypothetical protein [Elusimicrobiota bacterium]